MNGLKFAGAACALLSIAPLWYGLSAIARADYFGALLALIFTWVVARTGIELAAMGGRGAHGEPLGSLSVDEDSGP